jgi:hypothetical protein
MFGRKGQGAMEYLMTYGWAVLVVMIVGVVMWQMGIFNLGSTAVTSSGFPKIKPQLVSCKMTIGGDFSCLFTNGAGTGLTINQVFVSAGPCITTTPAVSDKVSLGDNFMVSATGCNTGVVGDPYVADVAIAYTLRVGDVDITHNDSGKIRGPYEQG